MGYIEALEFSQLGLLAITFVSTSSHDDDLQKLGYESLGSFKMALQVIFFQEKIGKRNFQNNSRLPSVSL